MTDQFKTFKKAMPTGTLAHPNALSWRKRGGHAGAGMITRAIAKLEKLGFSKHSRTPTGSPDGNVVGSKECYMTEDGYVLTFGSSYGATSTDNSFWMYINRPGRRANASLV